MALLQTESTGKCLPLQCLIIVRRVLIRKMLFMLILMSQIPVNDSTEFTSQSTSISVSASSNSASTASNEFFNWLTFRNQSAYSPIVPARPDSVPELKSATEMALNGLGLSRPDVSGAAQVEMEAAIATRRMRKHRHRVDANTPFTRRAICPFEYVLNHRPNRIPATLIEVKCLSPTPSQRLLGRRLPFVECEPMRWNVRILECQNGGGECQRADERIPLACVPVLQATKDKAGDEAASENGEMSAAAVISVPAQPLDNSELPI